MSTRIAPRLFAAIASLGLVSAAPQDPPAPAPDDVKSIDATLDTLYEVISGPAGQQRDWDRFRALFVPGARLIPTAPRPDGPGARAVVLTPDQFAERAGEATRTQGFFETEIHREVVSFGRIAHVWSTYESRHAKGEDPFTRGINSIQLLHDGDRWLVVTIFWDSESPDHPIPPQYLPKE